MNPIMIMRVRQDGVRTHKALISISLAVDGITGVEALEWVGMIHGYGIVVLDGTIGDMVDSVMEDMDGVGIAGIDGIDLAGEAMVAGAGITGVTVVLALPTLGALLLVTDMLTKDITAIEVMPIIQEDVVTTIEIQLLETIREQRL